MQKMMVVALASVLAGCASAQWVKPGATAADFASDKAQCEYQANLATPGTPYYDQGSAIASGISDGIRLAQLQRLCLQARGWALASPEEQSSQAGASAPIGVPIQLAR